MKKVTKRFIDITPMREDLLKALTEKFLQTDHYNSDTINVSLSLKDSVEELIKQKNLAEPKIYILDTAWLKIQKLVAELNSEVAWHCLVEQHPDNKYLIYDVLVFPQEVTGATVVGVDGDYEMWLATLPDEQFEHCRCHMHSHVNMGVTPSGTDENYYANLMTQVQDYYITMIINKSHTYYLRFYDKINNILYDNIEFTICTETGTTYNDWYESVKDQIKTKTFTYTPTYQSSLYSFDTLNKKKETTSTTPSTTRMSGGNTTTKSTEFIINSPFGECLVFTDINEATNYIYKYYEDNVGINDYQTFTRNQIRTRLAHAEAININSETLEFIEEEDIEADENIMEYVFTHCDRWEVE